MQMSLSSTFGRILRDPCFYLLMSIPLTLIVVVQVIVVTRPPATHSFTCIDETISSLNSAVIVDAQRNGSETVLTLSDGRVIVVTGYKGHHFYLREPLPEIKQPR